MIKRRIFTSIKENLFKGKVIIIYGPRQSGKTTLLNEIKDSLTENILMLDGDEPDTRQKLTNVTSSQLKTFFSGFDVVMIDEAQRIENIGLTIKLIADKIKNIQLIATGSSSFELANKIMEPLTGRKIEYHLFPFSISELKSEHGETEEKRQLENRLIYGMYPEVVTNPGNAYQTLKSLTTSYLYKDILAYNDLRKPELFSLLLEALALQVGSEVSFHELGQIVHADPVTIERYIYMLEQAFVIFRLRALSRNVRNELKKSRKIYFTDNGVRNAIIANFSPLNLRTDKGALWENFLVCERYKVLHQYNLFVNTWFWRTTQQQEIDYLEEKDGHLFAWEFKINPLKKGRLPKTFSAAYPNHSFDTITPENYFSFLE
ncbi:MAG: ATP-binding protein [Bacteroidales bacterium]|nr:ATP-binding protein [Bacteroidales bacterium]